jgi:hypothetical protein
MRPSAKTMRGNSALLLKLGLFILPALLPLLLMACACQKNQVSRLLPEDRGFFLESPAVKPASQTEVKEDLLQVCAVVPDEELQDMRGCQGVYYFDFTMDINLRDDSPKVDIKYTAAVPDGSPPPSLNGAVAHYADDNVYFKAGPTPGSGLESRVIVAGNKNIVYSTSTFNFYMPDASKLIPTINILPGSSLTGVQ